MILSKIPKLQRNISIYKPMISPHIQRIQNNRLITAIKTPYNNDGSIDLNSFDYHLEKQLKYGVDGFVIGGTTGEGHLFSWDEHIMLIAHAKYKFGNDCIIIGNTGSNSTREAIHATRQGFAVGMDAVYNNHIMAKPEIGILQHFYSVLDEGPGIIYNVPGRTAQDININTMMKISQHNNFVE